MIKRNNHKSASISRYDILLSILVNFIIILFISIYMIMPKRNLEMKKDKNLNMEISIVINDLGSSEKNYEKSSEKLISHPDTSAIDNKIENKLLLNNDKREVIKSNVSDDYKSNLTNSSSKTSNANSNNLDYTDNKKVESEESKISSLPVGLIDKGSYYLAENSNISGINYEILDQFNPDTTILSKNNYNKKIIIKAKMLVSENGKVENVVILSGENPYGIHSEVIKALKKWKFSKLSYNGKPLKIYFIKTFVL